MAFKKSTNKIPLDDFCKQTGKKRDEVYRLVKKNKLLKSKVYGERTMRINMDEWAKVLENA
jgi:predicted DNA-binding transcriptional regulator AlpA